jgi:hypothetical protein
MRRIITMPTAPTTATTATKWANVLQAFRETSSDHAARALTVLDELVTESLPAFRLSKISHLERARRISLASILARCRKEAGPGDVAGKLRQAMQAHPALCATAQRGLHVLKEYLRARPEVNMNPPYSALSIMVPDPVDNGTRALILAEINSLTPGSNAVTLLVIAYEELGASLPERFGSVSLENEAKDITDALARVAEVKAALAAEPQLRDRLLTKYGVGDVAGDPAEALLAARAAASR